MLDTAVLAGRRSEVMPATMELASKVFKMSSKETKAETLTRWGKGLIALRAHVERGDVAAAIVVAWDYDLVEDGIFQPMRPVGSGPSWPPGASSSQGPDR